MGKVTRSEWKWVGFFSAAVALAFLLPYLIAYQAQGSEWRFSGFLWGVDDGNSYIAKMREGADGAWLYHLAYSTESHTPAAIFLPYLILGKLAGGAGLQEQLAAILHLARTASVVACIFSTYLFLSLFLAEVKIRRWALAVITLGGGLGWILAIFGVLPLEYYSPESFSFLELTGSMHLTAARALFLLALWFYLAPSPVERPLRRGAIVGLLLAAAWLFLPLAAPIGAVVMGAHLLLRLVYARAGMDGENPLWKEYTKRFLIAAAIILPPVCYSAFFFLLDPVWRQFSSQNLVLAPEPSLYLAAYGLMLVFALGGLFRAKRNFATLLLAGWLIATPFLVYSPTNLQRRLADGVWVALVALAAFWFEQSASVRIRRALLPAILGVSLPACIFIYVGMLSSAASPNVPAFLPAAQVRAYAWLDAHAESSDIVVSDYETGNAMPAFASVRVFFGHSVETANFTEKARIAQSILDPFTAKADRDALLEIIHARFVMLNPEETKAARGQLSGCRLVYHWNGWSVWEYPGW